MGEIANLSNFNDLRQERQGENAYAGGNSGRGQTGVAGGTDQQKFCNLLNDFHGNGLTVLISRLLEGRSLKIGYETTRISGGDYQNDGY